jgi:hypothetical protein
MQVLALSHKCQGKGYIHVVGEVTDYYDVKEIIAFDVHPVSSGNKLTYHFLDVAYLFKQIMEYAEDEVLRAVDCNKFICKLKKATGKIENEALTTVEDVENEEPSPVDFNRITSEHIEDIAN